MGDKRGNAIELAEPSPMQNLLLRTETATSTTGAHCPAVRKVAVQNNPQLRRKSDFCTLYRYGDRDNNGMMANERALITSAQHPNLCLQRTVSARFTLSPSLTSPSIASTPLAINSSSSVMAKRRCSRVINFGYACAVYYLDGKMDESAEWYEEPEVAEEVGTTTYGGGNVRNMMDSYEPEGETPGAERAGDGPDEEGKSVQTVAASSTNHHQPPRELFLLRYRNEELPYYCIRPQGIEADRFIQSLSDRNRIEIKKFLDRNPRPEDGDWSYLWISQDLKLENCPVFILSIKMLENYFKNERMRRVKWHHLSMDKISVYRYSLPQITTKFRLRVARFLARHYRCCILCIWLLVILCISIGIICSVMFGSAPGAGQKANATFVPRNSAGPQERIGGFMDDEGPAEQRIVRIDHHRGTGSSPNSVRGFLLSD